jgi:hypothetical protein
LLLEDHLGDVLKLLEIKNIEKKLTDDTSAMISNARAL